MLKLQFPAALLITELVSNSLKQAFHPDTNGTISIKMYTDNGGLVLIVAADGVGFTEESKTHKNTEFGLNLVNHWLNS